MKNNSVDGAKYHGVRRDTAREGENGSCGVPRRANQPAEHRHNVLNGCAHHFCVECTPLGGAVYRAELASIFINTSESTRYFLFSGSAVEVLALH